MEFERDDEVLATGAPNPRLAHRDEGDGRGTESDPPGGAGVRGGALLVRPDAAVPDSFLDRKRSLAESRPSRVRPKRQREEIRNTAKRVSAGVLWQPRDLCAHSCGLTT
jgi:hypothetical protein